MSIPEYESNEYIPSNQKYDMNSWDFYLKRIDIHKYSSINEQDIIRSSMQRFHESGSSKYSPSKIPNNQKGILDGLFNYLLASNLATIGNTIYNRKDEDQLSKELIGCKILIITANDIEKNILHQQIIVQNPTQQIIRIIAGNVAYFIFHWGAYKVVHVHQHQIGANRDYGLRSTLTEVLNNFHPNVVFSLGVAFGIDPNVQCIGDVLVSYKVFPYSENKIINDCIYPDRSQDRRIDPWLDVRFANATGFLEGVTYGGILSGTSVLSSMEEKSRICRAYSKNDFVIGGEMEGSALFQVCGGFGIPCAVIKGICDWGAEKNSIYPDEPEKEAHLKTCAQAYAMTQVTEKCSILLNDGTLFSHSKTRADDKERKHCEILTSLIIITDLLLFILGFFAAIYSLESDFLIDYALIGGVLLLIAMISFVITVCLCPKREKRY